MQTTNVPGFADESSQHPFRNGRFRVACVAGVVVWLAFVALLRLPEDSPRIHQWVLNPVLVLLALVATVSCWHTARAAQGWNRRVWTWFGVSTLIWTLGRALTVYSTVTGAPPLHSLWTDVITQVSVIPLVLALVVIPPEPRVRSERFRSWLGAGVVVASVLLFCRALILVFPAPIVESGFARNAIHVSYPSIHVALATVVWIVLLRVGTSARLPLYLITAALLAYSWANVNVAYHADMAAGAPWEVLAAASAWCYVLFILAAISPHAAAPRPPSAKALSRYVGFQALAIYIPVLTAAVTVAFLPRSFDPALVVTGVAVLVLFGIRLMLLSADNSRLQQDLERRVDDLVHRSADLRRLGLQNERIVQSVVDGVIGLDASGAITFANPAAAAMLGYRLPDLLDLREEDVFHASLPARDESSDDCCVVRTAMVTGKARTSESQFFVSSDERVFPVELAVGPILEDNEITGAVVVFRDVSERRKIETMKNEFVSVVSHELRTPLTSIRGSLGLLAGGAAGALSSTADRMVAVALESSERLTRLINDMLDIERIESGTMPVELTDCNPAALIDQAIDTVRGVAGDHHLVASCGPHLALVSADADRIVQTLTNLIGNAIKFSPKGSTIEISAENNERTVDFAVADQGSGIPTSHLGKIFERFQQVDSSDGREKGGTGLGLAISRTIVRRHGGDLTVTSELGVGSTFRFSLPMVDQGVVETSHRHPVAVPDGSSFHDSSMEGVADPQLVGSPRVLPDGKTAYLAG